MIRQTEAAQRFDHSRKPNPAEALASATIEMTDAHASPGLTPWCSVITVTYNSARTLEHFWSSTSLSDEIEWIVVDNASTDDTVQVARELGATVIPLERNHGFSYANNVGYSAARSDFVGFINPDVRLDIDALRKLRDAASTERAIVGPQLRNPDGTRQPNGRGFPTLAAKIRNRIKGADARYLLHAEAQLPRPVVWLMGAAVLGHRAQFDRFGAWDSHFFLYYEDSDLGLRSWKAGVPVLLIPTADMEHGWARETAGGFRITPWMREIPSMIKFYARYPALLLTRSHASRTFDDIHSAVFEAEEDTPQ